MQFEKFINPELLEDNCAFCEYQQVRRNFTEDQLIEKKDQFFQLSTLQNNREQILNDIKEALNRDAHEEVIEVLASIVKVPKKMGKVGLKTLKKMIKITLLNINNGYIVQEEKVFAFDYQELGRMVFYDENGHYLYDRSLRPEEHQTNIHSLKRTS